MDDSIQYYYADESKQPVGPFSIVNLRMMQTSGILPPDVRVCPDGGDEWGTLDLLRDRLSEIPPDGVSSEADKNTVAYENDKSNFPLKKNLILLGAVIVCAPVGVAWGAYAGWHELYSTFVALAASLLVAKIIEIVLKVKM